MPGRGVVRSRAAASLTVTGDHPIGVKAPRLAAMLEECVRDHVVPETRSTYGCAVSQFERFMELYDAGPAFPADAVWVSAWVLKLAMDVSIPTIKTYLAAVKHEHASRGLEWSLGGNELVRRAMRFVSRKYGVAARSLKFPITIELLRRVFGVVPGWPCLADMSHDDRVFVTASVVGVLGFLRGGEFLSSPRSSRPILRAQDLCVCEIRGVQAVLVLFPKPKARWWLKEAICTSWDGVNSALWVSCSECAFTWAL